MAAETSYHGVTSEAKTERSPGVARALPPAPTRGAARVRSKRYRDRLIARLWRGKVDPCGGPGACLWAGMSGAECRCDPARPCECERHVLEAIENDAARRFGGAVGGLVTSALVDLARSIRSGDEASIRGDRIKLIATLTRDDRGRRGLDLGAKRLAVAEKARKPKVPSVASYLSKQKSVPFPTAAVAPPTDSMAGGEGPEAAVEGHSSAQDDAGDPPWPDGSAEASVAPGSQKGHEPRCD